MSDGSDDADPLLRAIAAAPARPPPPLGAARVSVGELVAGRFVIGSIAHNDDTSTRFHATDRDNGASVVATIARARWAEGAEVARQLEQLAALSHPALARPIATGALADGSAVVISEALDGTTLADWLARQGTLSVGDCVQLARRLADALAALHARGVVHGDVQTANVLLPGDDLACAKLTGATDARLHPRSKALGRATASGERACYAPPELVRGVTDLDARADVFALGCVLFECLTGRPPFAGATEAAAVAKLLVERAPRVRTQRAEIPAALDAMVAAMLEHDRQNRPDGGDELLRALALLDDGFANTVRSTAAIAPGVVLVDRYEIAGELGRGGMGRVFAARDRRLDRDVAIKLLVGEATDSRAFSRLEQEARAASRINHPNIATVHDVLATDHGPCIVSERLEGATLRDKLASTGELPADEVRALGAQLAAGLAAAHERAVLHRDLKPANLFITADGRLKILDFGLAKFLESDPNAPATEEGAVLGTVGYMAPEQVRGERADARSDLFSAGIVLYEALVGRRPFEGASRYEIESRILQQPPATLPANIPADLAATVLRCLEKAPALRFQSARELAAALQGTAPANSSSERVARGGRRAAIWSIVSAAGLLVVLASVAAVWRGGSRAPAVTAHAAPPAIAVLPFRDLSPDHSQQYLADGLAEEILTSLARVGGLHVAGRTSSFSFRDGTDDVRTIAQKLGVGVLVDGSVQRAGPRVRVSARLINAADGYQLWAQDFDRSTTDLLAIEDEVTRDVVGALKVKLAPGEHTLPSNRGSHDPEAYNDYLLAGRRDGSYQSFVKARRDIERALARDPQFAAGWARYAAILCNTVFTDGVYDLAAAADLFDRSKKAVNQAIELDPNLADGYVVRAQIRYLSGDWNLQGALSDLERVLALDPNNFSALATKAQLLQYFSNRVDEALTLSKRAVELDPISAGAWNRLAFSYRRAGRLAESKAAYERSEEISPGGRTELFLAELEVREGHLDKALALVDGIPESEWEFRDIGRTMVLVAMHRDAEARATVRHFASKLAQSRSRSAYLGAAYAMIGELDRAFAIFDDCLAHGDVALADVIVAPWTEELRDNPRYKAFVAKMHLLD